MKRVILLLTIVAAFALTVAAQAPNTITVKPEDQARIKPLVEVMNKAQEPLIAKRSSLPESKAVTDAQALLQKATDAQTAALQKLPEFKQVQVAEAKLLDEIYRILAEYKLSSRDYKPTINDKGELAFVRIEPPKQ